MSANLDVERVLDALEAWINQNPELNPSDYGCAPGQEPDKKRWRQARLDYNLELAAISRQGTAARRALREARGWANQHDGEIMAEAFQAFSGRLEWLTEPSPGEKADGLTAESLGLPRLEYTTGQYFPTEYRAAAKAVLDAYCAGMRRKYGKLPTHGGHWTIADIKAANRAIGGHFFDRDTIRFFASRVLDTVYEGPGGVFFVTSEQFRGSTHTEPRNYTVRKFDPETGSVDTMSGFNNLTKGKAQRAARDAAAGMRA